MSSVLYYSNYCDKSKNILRILGKSEQTKDMHFICIDKRFRNNENGSVYVILENQQKIVLPPQVQKVPAMLLLKEGNKNTGSYPKPLFPRGECSISPSARPEK